jgi:hypothetical protein
MRAQFVLVSAVAAATASTAFSAPINYGNKVGTNIIYQNVTEDSSTDATPLYGNPAVAGDSLVFNPVSFGASSSNGGAPDITDGTLTTTIVAKPNQSIVAVNLAEKGDYTLAGTGTAVTSASVSAPYFIRVIEVDGVSINPISTSGNLAMSPSGGTYDLPSDPGVGVLWTGSASVNINALLAANNISGKATKVTLSMDNVLTSFSQQGTVSFIKKKEVDGTTVTIIVPEPATLGVLGGVALMALRRSRR